MSHGDDCLDQSQIDAGPLPERAYLSLQRQWGCIALFLSHFEVIYEVEQATFHCHSQAQVQNLAPFRHDLPRTDFAALWQALQASDPAHWAAEYGQGQGLWSTGTLSGALGLDYTLDGQAFSRIIRFLEEEFDGDEQMQRLYAYLVEFEKTRLEFEAVQQKETP